MEKMENYKFVDDETGEEFLVQEKTFEAAMIIAKANFENPLYQGAFTDQEAEWMGLDTY